MNLAELAAVARARWIAGDRRKGGEQVRGVALDSRRVRPGEVFVCIRGTRTDGHRYIREAFQRGALAAVMERPFRGDASVSGPLLMAADSRCALARISAAYFGYPAERLCVIGITGTKGKTTTAWMLKALLEAAGLKTGILGTLGAEAGGGLENLANTTPDAFTIHRYFAKMIDTGCRCAVMEVSSQGIREKRILGIPFAAGAFTCFGRDHIGPGEHRNMQEYLECKARLFAQCRLCVGNVDDACFGRIFRYARGPVYGYSCKRGGNRILRAERIAFPEGEDCTVFTAGPKTFRLGMPGLFNVYNALAAVQTAVCLGVPVKEEALETVRVRGRMERVSTGKNIACYIDYAHNALSLEKALETLRKYTKGRLIVVFGCGGNRSGSRRAQMGEVAGRLADITILTSDNPRLESPEAILGDIGAGIRKTGGIWYAVPDRREAVKKALGLARPGDTVLVAGKGHETYQDVGGVRLPMDDRELIRDAWKERKD